MKIVVTGSTGSIGKDIVSTLKSNNIDVIPLRIDLSSDFNIDIKNVDGLIHCAGINNLSDYKNINDDEFMKLLRINSLSFLKLCQQIKFNDNSNIVAIGSLYSQTVKPLRLMYSFSKHGLLSIVKTLALELADRKIKVNMISPGFVDTFLTRKNNTTERIEELNNLIPLGLTESHEIAKMCLYLMNNNAITGQNIVIDGGYSCLEP